MFYLKKKKSSKNESFKKSFKREYLKNTPYSMNTKFCITNTTKSNSALKMITTWHHLSILKVMLS